MHIYFEIVHATLRPVFSTEQFIVKHFFFCSCIIIVIEFSMTVWYSVELIYQNLSNYSPTDGQLWYQFFTLIDATVIDFFMHVALEFLPRMGLLGQRVSIFLLLLLYLSYCFTIKLYQFSTSAVNYEVSGVSKKIMRVSWEDMRTAFPGFEFQLCHLPLTSCVTLEKLFNLPVPQLLPL